MRIDQLDVVLRARSQWEAMELGTALVRRHAAAIWKPWLLLTLPIFALLNLVGWWLDSLWLPPLLLWWIKPAFDRIPLYVISRGAFGAPPGTGDTLRAQWQWGWRGLIAYLSWRRLSPARSLLMPVDLLEGGDATQRQQRRHALGGASYGHAAMLTLVCANFELMLQIAFIALVFMFIPVQLLPESLQAAWSLIGVDTPAWAWVGTNFFAWAAMTLIGPFYVGAGFGMYLNRRTQLEGWDIEIAFRRLRERLAAAAPLLVLLLIVALPGAPLHAQHAKGNDRQMESEEADDASLHRNRKGTDAENDHASSAKAVFRAQTVDTSGFRQAVARAYEDPTLGTSRTVMRWKAKNPGTTERESREAPDLGFLGVLIKYLTLVAEWILWILLGLVALTLALTARWWLAWLRGSARRRTPEVADAITRENPLIPDMLPPDIIASARKLWRDGKPRHALALLYRASVETLTQRANLILPPGATEAQCLRASRKMPQEADRQLFAKMVRAWQYAAYAGRLPDDATFESLLDELQQQYGWSI